MDLNEIEITRIGNINKKMNFILKKVFLKNQT